MVKMVVVGCKLLREDGGSLRESNRVIYPVDEWIEVPGNGAYVAVTGGLTLGGVDLVLAYFECADPTGALAPRGVMCFRRVRRLPEPAPKRITPGLRGDLACWAPDLSAEQRMKLALESTPEWRGMTARYAPNLSAEQRVTLAQGSALWWRVEVARWAPNLSAEQRMELRRQETLAC